MQCSTVTEEWPLSGMLHFQFSSRWYLCTRKSPYALHPVLQKFPQRCLWNGSSVRPIDDGLLSSFQGRSSSASSFHASLLQAIDGVMPLALCPQMVSQVSQHLRSSEKQATGSKTLKKSYTISPCAFCCSVMEGGRESLSHKCTVNLQISRFVVELKCSIARRPLYYLFVLLLS